MLTTALMIDSSIFVFEGFTSQSGFGVGMVQRIDIGHDETVEQTVTVTDFTQTFHTAHMPVLIAVEADFCF